MINLNIRFEWIGLTLGQINKRKDVRLRVASEKSLRLVQRTLRKNTPYSPRPKKETHPTEPRMRDAIRSKNAPFGQYGGSVFIDTNICPHAYYYVHGRSGGGRRIYPKNPNGLLHFYWKKTGQWHFFKSVKMSSWRGNVGFLKQTVDETAPKVEKIFRDMISMWVEGI